MDDTKITTLEQITQVLKSTQGLIFEGVGRVEIYAWIEAVLKRLKYFDLNRRGKGQVKTYMQRMSGLSRAQLTRLVTKFLLEGSIQPTRARRSRFPAKYTDVDKQLLVHTDNVHNRLSGPATKKILERQYLIYGDTDFVRLQTISVAHIYRLRHSRIYQRLAQTFTKTQSVCIAIGIRRKPNPQGKPGYIRVDTVHQGDLDGEKGVYHINLVDEVTQWEILICVSAISEAHLGPALALALLRFPFLILGFHSDNGKEFINGVVAKLLNKILVEQTKSRSGHCNDNALVESKNGSVIRKLMGYSHIERKHAPLIDQFYQEHFNAYLNFHRPCAFATLTIDDKGLRRKKYETYQTPHERLKSIKKVARHLREGVSMKALDKFAAQQSDNAAAAAMQMARDRLFRRLNGRVVSTAASIVTALRRP